MVIGWNELVPRSENEVGIDSVGQTILVDERLGITNQNSKENQVVVENFIEMALETISLVSDKGQQIPEIRSITSSNCSCNFISSSKTEETSVT